MIEAPWKQRLATSIGPEEGARWYKPHDGFQEPVVKHFTRLRGDLQEHGTIKFVSLLPIDPDVMDTHPRIPITAMSPKSEARQNIVT